MLIRHSPGIHGHRTACRPALAEVSSWMGHRLRSGSFQYLRGCHVGGQIISWSNGSSDTRRPRGSFRQQRVYIHQPLVQAGRTVTENW